MKDGVITRLLHLYAWIQAQTALGATLHTYQLTILIVGLICPNGELIMVTNHKSDPKFNPVTSKILQAPICQSTNVLVRFTGPQATKSCRKGSKLKLWEVVFWENPPMMVRATYFDRQVSPLNIGGKESHPHLQWPQRVMVQKTFTFGLKSPTLWHRRFLELIDWVNRWLTEEVEVLLHDPIVCITSKLAISTWTNWNNLLPQRKHFDLVQFEI